MTGLLPLKVLGDRQTTAAALMNLGTIALQPDRHEGGSVAVASASSVALVESPTPVL